jgi:hypothetical protein
MKFSTYPWNPSGLTYEQAVYGANLFTKVKKVYFTASPLIGVKDRWRVTNQFDPRVVR